MNSIRLAYKQEKHRGGGYTGNANFTTTLTVNLTLV